MTDFQGPRCETCEFWIRGDDNATGLCRRYPPSVITWRNPNPKTPAEQIIIRAQFPPMLPSGWCGEHQQA